MFRENPTPLADEGRRRRSDSVAPTEAGAGADTPGIGTPEVGHITGDPVRGVDVEEIQAELRRQFRRLEKERRDLATERMALEREAEAIRGRFRAEVVALRDLVAALTEELDQIVQHRRDA